MGELLVMVIMRWGRTASKIRLADEIEGREQTLCESCYRLIVGASLGGTEYKTSNFQSHLPSQTAIFRIICLVTGSIST